MYFLLHHSTGALMLDAKNREDAMAWGKRQLGGRKDLVTLLEIPESLPMDWVERSGTGIKAKENGCEPRLSLMADSVQRVTGIKGEMVYSFDWYQVTGHQGSVTSIH